MNKLACFALLLLLLTSACRPVANPETETPLAPASTSQSEASPQSTVQSPPAARLHFGRIGLEDGLSQSVVLSIVQDNLGFMWFGTQDGLNRYDGRTFRVFNQIEGDSTSLSDAWVCSLVLDAQGNLWAGTRMGGANRYDARTGTFTRYQHQENVAGSLSDNNVHALFSDSQGSLWLGTNTGLDLFDPDTQTFSHYQPPENTEFIVQAIAQDPQGILWLGTPHALWRFDPAQKEFSSFMQDGESFPVNAILAHPDGTLWLTGVGSGLLHFTPQSAEFTQYLAEKDFFENTQGLWLDPSGTIWVGTYAGLILFDPVDETFTHYSHDPNVATTISSNIIFSLYQDRSGLLWIGSYGGSLSTYDPLANQFIHYYAEPKNPKSLADNSIFAIEPAPDGTVWIGTYGSGLEHFDPHTGEFTHYFHDPGISDSLANNFIFSLQAARDGALWVGTQDGLDRLDTLSGTFTHYTTDPDNPDSLPGNHISAIFQDSSDRIWVGTLNGLARFNNADQTFTHYTHSDEPASLSDDWVTQILEDHTGMFWIGTFNSGLNRFDPQNKKFTHYRYDPQLPGSIGNDTILSIHESENGNLWVGTAGGGLNHYDPAEDSFTVYREPDGLPNNVIYAILEDAAGNLWLSTNRGLSRFNPQSQTFRNYTTADGLQSNEFNQAAAAEDAAGVMYFGGINGLNLFHPAEIRQNEFIPPISLVSVTQNGSPLQVGITPEYLQDITLRYPENSFEFEFAALSYSQSKKNQHAYTLEGFDSDWYFASTNRTGRYANLPGGEYTLRLKAANADGVWNEDGLALKVTVIPPFWQTGWFYGLAGLVVIASVFGVYRLRVHNIEAQKRELEHQVAERTREIEQLFKKTKELAILEERNRLARDLHDSAKQKAFAALAQLGTARSLTNGDREKAARHLQEAETLVGEVIQEITFLIQEIHPAALKEKGLSTALREYVFEWGNRTGSKVDLEINGECCLPFEIEQALYRSIQEALANVARHSGADRVTLVLHIQPGSVSVSLSDNGQGFDPRVVANGMGLRSIRERVESLGGVFTIDSAPGAGTQLAIRIPVEELP